MARNWVTLSPPNGAQCTNDVSIWMPGPKWLRALLDHAEMSRQNVRKGIFSLHMQQLLLDEVVDFFSWIRFNGDFQLSGSIRYVFDRLDLSLDPPLASGSRYPNLDTPIR